MVKLKQVDNETTERVELKNAKEQKKECDKNKYLEFVLSSGLKAVFAIPEVHDLIAAEKKPGTILKSEGMNATTAAFYREIGKACCTQWGKASKIPEEIKSGDDSTLTDFFMQLINTEYVTNFEQSNCVRDLFDQATENEAGDIFTPKELTLTTGEKVVFKQVSSRHIEQIERIASTNTSVEQYIKLAAQVCTKINGDNVTWVESQEYFNNIIAEDYIRVYLTLRSF